MTLAEAIALFVVGQRVRVLTSKGGIGVVVGVGRTLVKIKVGGRVQSFSPHVLSLAS